MFCDVINIKVLVDKENTSGECIHLQPVERLETGQFVLQLVKILSITLLGSNLDSEPPWRLMADKGPWQFHGRLPPFQLPAKHSESGYLDVFLAPAFTVGA
jgi:hypothetical protein